MEDFNCRMAISFPAMYLAGWLAGWVPTITGAACYDAYEALTPEGGKLYLINTNGQCETNTINRAELSAILQALIIRETTRGDLTIYTDSLCSIYMIQKALEKPVFIRHNTVSS